MRDTKYFALGGGENLVDAALSLDDGELLFSENYEPSPLTGMGYKSIDGYEAFDGQPNPSDADYVVLNFDAGTTEISVADIVDGATSSATGEALVVTVESGAWATNDAAGYLILFNVTGTYQDDENLQVSAVTYAVANGASEVDGADNDTNDDTWTQAAIEARRADIAAVPGSGDIRGVWAYSGTVYAIRDNAGGTAGVMHKATTSGWSEINLGAFISFTLGTSEILEGEVVTGGTSGATGTVAGIVVESGTWAGNDAAGKIYLHTITGTYQSEAITSATGAATCSGAQTANALSAGGQYEFISYNFVGAGGSKKMYFVNGVDRASQFDGTGFTPVTTGMTTDTPTHIIAHRNHLFLSFAGSVQYSSLGNPLTWSVVTGAGELSTGEDVVGFDVSPGGVLTIFNRNSTYLLYGSDADWNLVTHSLESGAIEWTVQSIGRAIYFDDRGITELRTVQEYGDFKGQTLTRKIWPYLEAKKTLVTTSMRVKDKDQYRLFFSDNYAITLGFSGGRVTGITRQKYDTPVICCCSAEDSNGDEVLYFGSDDGFVYQLDKGTSFNGSAIETYLQPVFNHFQSPVHNKRFHKIVLELDSPDQITLQFTPNFSYGSDEYPSANTTDMEVTSGGGYWDIDNWNEFLWSEQIVASAEGYISGVGTNMGITLYSTATYKRPHTIQGVIVHYEVWGINY